MGAKDLVKQYGVLIVGLMIGGGFAFGGIASYAGMINTGSGGQDANFSMPSSYYTEGTFGLSYKEQRTLAYNEDVVFVNAIYDSPEGKKGMEFLGNTSSEFSGRAYVQVTNASKGSLVTSRFGLSEYPAAVVVGGARNGVKIVRDFSRESVSSAVCGVMRDWGSLAAKCQVQ